VSQHASDLLADCDWLWVEALRDDVRPLILDALGRLSRSTSRTESRSPLSSLSTE
jgi:hypothetical protein